MFQIMWYDGNIVGSELRMATLNDLRIQYLNWENESAIFSGISSLFALECQSKKKLELGIG